MKEFHFWITNRFGEKLEALLRKPSKNSKFPCVLFVSGFGMDLHEYINSNDEISKRLVHEGFLTLQFSFSGRGKSEGDFTQMTLERQAQQIEDVLLWLSKRKDVDRGSIGLHATSMGVPSALLAKSDLCSSFCFVSGAYEVSRSIHKVFEEERGVKINYEGITKLPRSSDEATTPVGPGFWKSIAAFDPKLAAGNITIPTFLIHGDQDNKVTTEETEKVFALIPTKTKKLKIFKNGDHGITDVSRKMREEFLGDVVNWFKRTL